MREIERNIYNQEPRRKTKRIGIFKESKVGVEKVTKQMWMIPYQKPQWAGQVSRSRHKLLLLTSNWHDLFFNLQPPNHSRQMYISTASEKIPRSYWQCSFLKQHIHPPWHSTEWVKFGKHIYTLAMLFWGNMMYNMNIIKKLLYIWKFNMGLALSKGRKKGVAPLLHHSFFPSTN